MSLFAIAFMSGVLVVYALIILNLWALLRRGPPTYRRRPACSPQPPTRAGLVPALLASGQLRPYRRRPACSPQPPTRAGLVSARPEDSR